MKHFFSNGLTLLLLSSSCGKSTESTEPGKGRGFRSVPVEAGDPESYQPIVEPSQPLIAAAAVDLNNQKGQPISCVAFTEKIVPNQLGVVDLNARYSEEEIENELSGSASIEGAWKWLSASASGRYFEKIKTNAESVNFAVRVYSKHHSKVYLPTARNEMYKSVSPEQWEKDCGQGYVAAQDFGSYLFINFTLSKEALSKDSNWDGGLNVSIGKGLFGSLADLKVALSGISKTKKSSGTLGISAIQIGGRPADLGKILKREGSAGVVESFVLCNLAEGEKCMQGIKNIEEYISKDFPAQMDDKETGGPSALTHYTFRYPKSIGIETNPLIDELVKNARSKIGKLYESELQDITNLAAAGAKEDDETLALARKNLELIRKAATICYQKEGYGKCAALAAEIEESCAKTKVTNTVANPNPQ